MYIESIKIIYFGVFLFMKIKITKPKNILACIVVSVVGKLLVSHYYPYKEITLGWKANTIYIY